MKNSANSRTLAPTIVGTQIFVVFEVNAAKFHKIFVEIELECTNFECNQSWSTVSLVGAKGLTLVTFM